MTEEQNLELECKLQSIERSVDLWLAGDPHSRDILVAIKEMGLLIDAQLDPAKRAITHAAGICSSMGRDWSSQGASAKAAAADACRDAILAIKPSILMDDEPRDIEGALRAMESMTDLWLAGPPQSGAIRLQVKQLRRWLVFHNGPITGDPTRCALTKALHLCHDLARNYNRAADSDQSMAAWECCTAVQALADERMEVLCDQF